MTRTVRQRILVTLTATMLAAAIGAVCGYLIGLAIAYSVTESELQESARRIQSQIELFSAENRAVLAKMNASPYPYCSDAEILYFRQLVYRSEYLKDAGRLRNGKIDCTTMVGKINPPSTVLSAGHTQKDNTQMYIDLAPPQSDNEKGIGVQLDDAFVVGSNFILAHVYAPPTHYTTTLSDALSGRASKLHGESPNVDWQLLTHDGMFWQNASLYFTRCSVRYFICTTTYVSLIAAWQAEQSHICILAAAGALLGAFLGMFSAIIYRRSLSMEQQLRRAIRQDKLRMVYQPIVDLASGRIVEAEALARWADEDGFAISPEVFVHVAEERGFVGELTELVVRQVIHDMGAMLINHPEFRININVTASDLADAKFLPMLERSLQEAGVAARSLAIEVTESSTARKQVAIDAIRQLRERGHSVQIDDFGTGYSSLAYLHDLSVDTLKIDRAFTQSIGTEAVTVGILPQILAMAEKLHLKVIAEGVETVEQAAYFAGAEMSILGQGWLFGRPVPAEGFHRLLAEAKEKAAAEISETENRG